MSLISLRNKGLLLVIFISFILPLGYSFFYRVQPVVDAQAYDRIAVNLVGGFGFKEDRARDYQFDTAIIRAGPGYEFFLAGVYKVFGHRYEVVWVLQALLHALSAWLLFLISRKIFFENGDKIGLIAVVFFGLHPDLIEISAMLMTETLYLFLIILTVWFLVDNYQVQRRSLWHVITFGLVNGLAILTRPPVILFVPIIGVLYLYQKNYRGLFLFGLGLVIALVPWVIRNYLIYHQFILTTLVGSYNLWVGNTLQANGGQISGGFNPLTVYTAAHGFFDLKSRASQEFLAFVVVYPFVFLKLCVFKFIRYFSLIRPMGFWFYQSGVRQALFVAFSALAEGVLFFMGFSGLFFSFREKKPLHYTLVILALTSPIVLLPAVVESRYRFQVYPFLAIFSGYALMAWYRNWGFIKKNILGVGIFLFTVSLIDVVQSWYLLLERWHLFIS